MEPATAWTTLVGAVLTISVSCGVRRSIGLIFLEVMDLCESRWGVTSLLTSVFLVCVVTFSPLVAVLTIRFGARRVVFGGGLLASISSFGSAFTRNLGVLIALLGGFHGLAHSCFLITSIGVVSRSFQERRSIAIALCGCGCSLGTVAIPPILIQAAEQFTASGMFIILSGINLQTLVTALLLSSPQPMIEENTETNANTSAIDTLSEQTDEKESSQSSKRRSRRKVNKMTNHKVGSTRLSRMRLILCNSAFYEVSIGVALCFIPMHIAFFVIPPLAEDAQISLVRQSLIILWMGVTDIFGRVLCGIVSDCFPTYRLHSFMFFSLLQIITWTSITFYVNHNFVSIMIFSLTHSFLVSFLSTIAVPIIVDVVGLDNVEITLACSFAMEAPAFIFMPPLMGMIREMSGSWRAACLMLLASTFLSSLTFFRRFLYTIRRKKQNDPTQNLEKDKVCDPINRECELSETTQFYFS